uniref:Major facilitator superfamily (MFS) profile domain-containing protein n=2 Tax=Photinus pyralis TaxID=7054 RepID=A0A1Y1MXE7_PHOPY
MGVSSLFTLLIPVMASVGGWALMLCRIIQGFTQGFFYPSCHNLLSKWVPPSERARLGTFVYAGGPFGTVVSLTFTGWISGTTVGWPYAFYTYGTGGLLWVVVWMVLGRNSPSQHTKIDPKEKAYIEAALGHAEQKELPSTPWRSIATSLPLWAILIAHSGQNWGFTTLLTNIPTFLQSVLHFDIRSNGLLSAGPYLLFWILSFAFSAITDYSITRGIFTTGTTRKIANSIGSLVPAASLVVLGAIGDTDADIKDAAIVLLFIAVGVNSFTYCGYNVNHMDISPNHAGTLMGITNGLSNITSIIAPLILEFIVTDEASTKQWAVVFYISAAVYVIGNTFFVIFASGEKQKWNSNEEEEARVTVTVEEARP